MPSFYLFLLKSGSGVEIGGPTFILDGQLDSFDLRFCIYGVDLMVPESSDLR